MPDGLANLAIGSHLSCRPLFCEPGVARIQISDQRGKAAVLRESGGGAAQIGNAVDHVSVVMTETLVAHSPAPAGSGAALDAARGAYAALVADRTILRFLMHANCAAGEPLVGQAVRRCYAKQVDTVRQLLGDDDAVRRWFGAGMLDNVVAVLGLADIDEPWARVLSAR